MSTNLISPTDLIAIAALVISLVLAYLTIRGYLRDHRGIHVSYAISGRPGSWNIVYMTNLSVVPIIVEHWEMVWGSRIYVLFHKYERIPLHDDEDLHISLKPHVTHKINFADQYEFNWHPKHKGRVNLFIKLQIAGRRKPLYILVYKPR